MKKTQSGKAGSQGKRIKVEKVIANPGICVRNDQAKRPEKKKKFQPKSPGATNNGSAGNEGGNPWRAPNSINQEDVVQTRGVYQSRGRGNQGLRRGGEDPIAAKTKKS